MGYRNVTDYSVNFNLASLPNFHWLDPVIFWWSLRFFFYKIMLPTNRDNFSFLFPISIHACICLFICLGYLIALARTSGIMLSKSGENRNSCLIPDLRRKIFNFSWLMIMLAVDLSYTSFIMLRYVSSILNLFRGFIMNGWLLNSFESFFFWNFEMILLFSFILLIWYITLIYLHMLNHSCIFAFWHSKDKSHLIKVNFLVSWWI